MGFVAFYSGLSFLFVLVDLVLPLLFPFSSGLYFLQQYSFVMLGLVKFSRGKNRLNPYRTFCVQPDLNSIFFLSIQDNVCLLNINCAWSIFLFV